MIRALYHLQGRSVSGDTVAVRETLDELSVLQILVVTYDYYQSG